MGIIASKRKAETPYTGIVTDTRYEKLLQEDATICDEKSPSVLGKEISATSIQTSEQINTEIADDDSGKSVEKQTKTSTRQSKSLTGQPSSKNSAVSQCNGHVSKFSIHVEPKSLLENPLLKRAEGESGKLKPVNPFRIGKEKDKERIELFESGLVNPHNRAGIVKHEINPREEEIIGELKGIGIISNKEEKNASEKTQHQTIGQVPDFSDITVEVGSIEENVHLLAGLSETSIDAEDTKETLETSESTSENTSQSKGLDKAQLALKMINMDVL